VINRDVGYDDKMRQLVQPLFNKYNISVYFSGHQHSLELLRDGSILYAISGAGSRIDTNATNKETNKSIFIERKLGYAVVDLQPLFMNINYFDKNGVLLFNNIVKPNK